MNDEHSIETDDRTHDRNPELIVIDPGDVHTILCVALCLYGPPVRPQRISNSEQYGTWGTVPIGRLYSETGLFAGSPQNHRAAFIGCLQICTPSYDFLDGEEGESRDFELEDSPAVRLRQMTFTDEAIRAGESAADSIEHHSSQYIWKGSCRQRSSLPEDGIFAMRYNSMDSPSV